MKNRRSPLLETRNRSFTFQKFPAFAFATLVFAHVLQTGCSQPQTSQQESSDHRPLSVAVVNYPLHYFVERIGGDHVNVQFPIPDSIDPAHWTPGGDEIAAFQNSDLIFINGAGHARWIKTATLPSSKMVNTSIAFQDRYVESENAITHSHGLGVSHSHAGIASTTWLDPAFAIEQARAVHAALLEKRPDLRELLNENHASLRRDLQKIDARLTKATAGKTAPLFFSHPVYQYLIRRFELDAKELHWEPNPYPSDRAREDFLRMRQNHASGWLLWEGDPDSKTVEWLHSNDVRSAVFDPCGNVPDNGDYLSVMLQNAENLAAALD